MSRAETRETVRRRGQYDPASGAFSSGDRERVRERAYTKTIIISQCALHLAGRLVPIRKFPMRFRICRPRAPRLLRTYPQCGRLGVSPRWLRRGLRETLDRHRMCRALLVANERAVGRVVAREVCAASAQAPVRAARALSDAGRRPLALARMDRVEQWFRGLGVGEQWFAHGARV